MLKNKFGMTKVLVLVLSVLMLVSLVACNKADGPSTDDMNAAIQAAIDAANAEQAAKEAALAASIAADKAAQEAKDAAQAESLAKEKAENDAALKKAQEEAAAAAKKAEEASKAAADAAKKAAEEAAKAAEEAAKANEAALKKAQEEAAAAKKAAEEASKAAAEAAAKAQSEADRVASELAAELEAAKAEALKAQEEAAKAQEEASKAIAEASKAAEEAAKASSQLAETTVVPATTPAETTVVAPAETTVAPETTTEAPVVIVDKTDALLKYSELKVKYTINDANKYLPANYAELVLLFDKANLDLNNATAEAAASIVATLETDALAVPSVKTAADKVQALIVDLKDIETEVFTVQAEQITAVRDAYDDFIDTYEDNLAALGYTTDALVQSKLGVNVADLKLAESKLVVLEAYIQTALRDNMKKIYDEDKRQNYDATVEIPEDATFANQTESYKKIKALIPEVYYQYLILAAINDGNVDVAETPVEWEKKADDRTQLDYSKPTKFFTVEDLMNVYILPTLDNQLKEYADELVEKLYANIAANGTLGRLTDAIATPEIDNNYRPVYATVSADLLDVKYSLADAYAAISFSEDFKGTATMAEAKEELENMAVKAYIDGLNVILAAAKDKAVDYFVAQTETNITALDTQISNFQLQLDAESNPVYIAKFENDIAKLEAAIVKAEADLEAAKANVVAATLMTYDEMLNKDLKKLAAYKDVWCDLTATDVTEADVVAYLNAVLFNTISVNFASEVGSLNVSTEAITLVSMKNALKADLTALANRLSPNPTGYTGTQNGHGDIFDELKVEWPAYAADKAGFENTETFNEIVGIVSSAIDAINAIETGTATETHYVINANNSDATKITYYYFRDAAAKAYAEKTVAEGGYAYSPANRASIALVVDAPEELVKSDKLANITNTDLILQYEVTAEELAIKTAVEKYVKAYDDVSNAINTKVASVKKLGTDAKATITGSGTAYKKLTDSYKNAGTLLDLIKDVGTKYESDISTIVGNHKLCINIEAKTFYANSAVLSACKTNGDFIVMMHPATITANDYANEFDYNGFADDLDAKVLEFYKNFYGINEVNKNTTATSVVEQLWVYQMEVVAKMKATMATYKNTYVAKGDELYDITAATALDGNYAYGVTGTNLEKNDVVAQAYEDALDELLEDYIELVETFKIKSGNTEIKDVLNNQIVKVEVNYNLDNAKKIIDAYYTKLFGDVDYVVHPKFAAEDVTYKAGNSAVFQTYNDEVLGNSFGFEKVD